MKDQFLDQRISEPGRSLSGLLIIMMMIKMKIIKIIVAARIILIFIICQVMFQHVPYFLKHDSPARVYRSAPSFREETEAQRVKVIPLKSHSSKWQWQDRVKKAPSGGPRWRHLELPFSFLRASRPGRHDFTVSNAEVWRRNLMSGARLVVNSALNCP